MSSVDVVTVTPSFPDKTFDIMAADLAAEIVAAATTADHLTEQQKEYRVVHIERKQTTGDRFDDRTAYAWWKDLQGRTQLRPLYKLLEEGWKIEREFTTTRTRILTSKIRKMDLRLNTQSGESYLIPYVCSCQAGCDHCMVVEKEAEVLVNLTNFVLSKRQA